MFNWYDTPFWCMMGASLVLMLLQLGGSDQGHSHHGDIHSVEACDPHLHAPEDLAGLAKAGKVPLSIWLMGFFFSTGLLGLVSNQVILKVWQVYPAWFFLVALGLAGAGGSMGSRGMSRLIGRLFQETTSASSPEDLIGSVGTAISAEIPTGEKGQFGRVRLHTPHGVQLQISCVTESGCTPPLKDQPVFITGYDPNHNMYTVLVHESDDYRAYLHGHSSFKELNSPD